MCAIPVMPLLVNIFVGRVNFMRNLCVTTGLQMVCNKSLLTALAVMAPCKDVSPPQKTCVCGSGEVPKLLKRVVVGGRTQVEKRPE